MYDIIIIGGGPAGMTAGIYTARANLKTLIIEKLAIGGQISEAPLVENYPGFNSITGFELAEKMYEQVKNLGVDFVFEDALEIQDGDVKKVITDRKTYETRAIIVASGSQNNRLGLENEEKFGGKGIHFCVSCDAAFYKDKIVAVIGGANSAVGNALYLSDIAKKVYLIYRKDALRAEQTLIDRVNKKENLEVLYNTLVTSFDGNDKLSSITIKKDDTESKLEVDGVFEAVGMQAQTSIILGMIQTNDANYIISEDCKTKYPWLFVAGDCRDKNIRQITTATADGTIAATSAITYLKTN